MQASVSGRAEDRQTDALAEVLRGCGLRLTSTADRLATRSADVPLAVELAAAVVGDLARALARAVAR